MAGYAGEKLHECTFPLTLPALADAHHPDRDRCGPRNCFLPSPARGHVARWGLGSAALRRGSSRRCQAPRLVRCSSTPNSWPIPGPISQRKARRLSTKMGTQTGIQTDRDIALGELSVGGFARHFEDHCRQKAVILGCRDATSLLVGSACGIIPSILGGEDAIRKSYKACAQEGSGRLDFFAGGKQGEVGIGYDAA
jgi:hypothetical protein